MSYRSASWSTSASADLELFKGTGTIGLPCEARGKSYTSDSAGNVIHGVFTKAAAYVIVTYTYDSSVPAASTTWGRIKALYR